MLLHDRERYGEACRGGLFGASRRFPIFSSSAVFIPGFEGWLSLSVRGNLLTTPLI
jgi:hypothetical protein